MKKYAQNKSVIMIIAFLTIFVMVPVIWFFGWSYVPVLLLLGLVYLYIYKFRYEEIISPKEFEQLQQHLSELEEMAVFIRAHLEDHDGDLQAKFELLEIEKEIEETKKQMGL